VLGAALEQGEVYAHDGSRSSLVWSNARDPELARRVLDESIALLSREQSSALQSGSATAPSMHAS
jgi:hypothetical protein